MLLQIVQRAALLAAGVGSFLAMTAAFAPASAQSARIWFYRDLNPNESLAAPSVRIDGATTGFSEPGGAFYRDVAPGRHLLSVDSYVNDRNQTIDVALAPGGEVYVKVVPNDGYVEGGGEYSGGYHRNSYVLWLYPPDVARAAIARLHLQGSVAALPPR